MEQDDSIWKRHQLRPTPCRRMVMECLDTSGRAMSEREIRLAVGEEFDRTTLYRNMISLEENGFIHRIVVAQGVVKYAANPDNQPAQRHAHFFCKHCGNVWCLRQAQTFKVEIPLGFQVEEEEIVVRGLCRSCQEA